MNFCLQAHMQSPIDDYSPPTTEADNVLAIGIRFDDVQAGGKGRKGSPSTRRVRSCDTFRPAAFRTYYADGTFVCEDSNFRASTLRLQERRDPIPCQASLNSIPTPPPFLLLTWPPDTVLFSQTSSSIYGFSMLCDFFRSRTLFQQGAY